MDQEFRISAIRAADCLREGWAAIKPHYGVFFGMIVVSLIVGLLASFVPFIGALLNMVVSAALTCGIFIAILASFRRELPTMSMMFEGFSRFFPAVVISFVQSVPMVIVAVVLVASGLIPTAGSGDTAGFDTKQMEELIQRIGAPLIASYAVAFLFSVFIKALLYFALPLVADRDLSASRAIALGFRAAVPNFGGIVLAMLIQWGLLIAGLFAFCVGIFFVLPVFHAIEVAAYRQVFVGLEEDPGPPPPDEYDFLKDD
jgi:hypothetical protein